jgi:hypothetical protein
MWLDQVPASMLKSRASGRRALDPDLLRSGDFVVFDDSEDPEHEAVPDEATGRP